MVFWGDIKELGTSLKSGPVRLPNVVAQPGWRRPLGFVELSGMAHPGAPKAIYSLILPNEDGGGLGHS